MRLSTSLVVDTSRRSWSTGLVVRGRFSAAPLRRRRDFTHRRSIKQHKHPKAEARAMRTMFSTDSRGSVVPLESVSDLPLASVSLDSSATLALDSRVSWRPLSSGRAAMMAGRKASSLICATMDALPA